MLAFLDSSQATLPARTARHAAGERSRRAPCAPRRARRLCAARRVWIGSTGVASCRVQALAPTAGSAEHLLPAEKNPAPTVVGAGRERCQRREIFRARAIRSSG